MKHLSDLQTEMEHLSTVNRNDNAEDEMSKQINQIHLHILTNALQSKRKSEELGLSLLMVEMM